MGLLNNLANTPVPTQLASFSELKTSVLNLHSPSSPDPTAITQPNSNANVSTPTDVMKHNFQENTPAPLPNQSKPAEGESQANATHTSSGISNYSIGSRSEEEPVRFLSTSPQSVSWVIARDRLEGVVILWD
ncbi:hypothetical protein DSO57_1018632 [Entomophthora muscae]|uniref:Uncharacterized protein n=1 Tax=Entomophthora muscae TaxID=34485 RepID=A0ACC2SHJ3_9FUNG|nr:hypothetical protein DSO57_1018632 [Entomophthora muscae]